MLGPRTAALLASALMSAAAHASEFESSDIYPADYPTVTAVAYMGKLIEEQTAGRHRIKPLGNDDLDSEGYTIAEVRMGKLAMADVFLIALYIVLAKGAGFGTVQVAWGLYLFTACILLSLALAHRSRP